MYGNVRHEKPSILQSLESTCSSGRYRVVWSTNTIAITIDGTHHNIDENIRDELVTLLHIKTIFKLALSEVNFFQANLS